MRNFRRGFGLVETLIAMVVALALAVAAMAGFKHLLDRFRVRAACADFRTALSVARSEAMRRRQLVDLLPLRRGDWRAGWQVAIDSNNNQRADPGEVVLHVSPAPTAVEVSTRLTDSSRDYVAFDPSGRPRTAASADAPQFGSIVFRAGEQRRKLLIGFLGRMRSCDPDRDGAAC